MVSVGCVRFTEATTRHSSPSASLGTAGCASATADCVATYSFLRIKRLGLVSPNIARATGLMSQKRALWIAWPLSMPGKRNLQFAFLRVLTGCASMTTGGC